MKMLSFLPSLVLLAPCFSCEDVTWTRERALASGESVFGQMIGDNHRKRSDFDEPMVELEDGFAVVGFRLRGTEDQGYTVTLGRNGCASITSGVHADMFRSDRAR